MPAKTPRYALDDWSPEAQRAFWARHARARIDKDVLIVGKAKALFDSGDPEKRSAAEAMMLELAERQEAEPKPGSLHRTSLARWLVAAGALDEAEAQLRRARSYLERPGANEAERISVGFVLATVLSRCSAPEAWAEAEALFEENQRKPVIQPCAPYRDLVAACTTPLVHRPHSETELREAIPSPLVSCPLAEVFLDELEVGAPTYAALQALDDVLLAQPMYARFQLPNLEREFFPDLGAHLGNVVVHEADATWEAGPTLTTSRVRLGGERLDPFQYAFHVLFRRYPLTDFLARLRFLSSLATSTS